MDHPSSTPGRRWLRGAAERPEAAGWPLLIAHRGASAHETENTVEAFGRAVREGADGIELDVLTAASGEVVVFHDDDLRRLADRPERVGALPWRVLKRIALPGGTRIPLLAEALEASGDLLVNVELKSAGVCDLSVPPLVEGVARELDRTGAAARVLVSSFDPRAVWSWQRRRPDVPTALLLEADTLAAGAKALALPFLFPFAVHPQHHLCRPTLVAGWRAAGYAVNTWTVDNPAEAWRLADMGVAGIITNDPGGLRAGMARLRSPFSSAGLRSR